MEPASRPMSMIHDDTRTWAQRRTQQMSPAPNSNGLCCIRKRHRPRCRACSIRWSRVLCQASVRTRGSASRSVATIWIRCSPIRRAPRSIIPQVDGGTSRSVANVAWVYPACWRSCARVLAVVGVDKKSPTVLPRTSAAKASCRGPGELWPVSQWLIVVASSPAAIARSSWVRVARCLAWRKRSGEKPWVRALDSKGSWVAKTLDKLDLLPGGLLRYQTVRYGRVANTEPLHNHPDASADPRQRCGRLAVMMRTLVLTW